MVTNGYGFVCEEMIRDLLSEIGIPHKYDRGEGKDWFWWASKFEDRVLGIDCWLTIGLIETPVDFTVISKGELIQTKTQKALGRGVVPVFLEQGMLRRAEAGDEAALRNLDLEIRAQVSLKVKMLNGSGMTRELASIMKEAMRPKVLVTAGA